MHSNSNSGFGSGFMNQSGMAPLAAPVENNTTVNNYYAADTDTDDSSGVDDVAADDTNWGDDSSVI